MRRVLFVCALCVPLLLTACGDVAVTVAPTIAPTIAPPARPTTAAPTVAPALAAATAAIAPTAPTAAPATSGPITANDATGTAVTVPKPATRVVVLGTSGVDVLAEFGILPIAAREGSPLVMAGEPTFFSERAKGIISISAPGGDPNLEEIARVKPDLVIGLARNATMREGLRTIAPLFILANDGGYQQTLRDTVTIAPLLGKAADADAIVQRFQKRLTAYRDGSPKNLKVLVMTDYDLNAFIATDRSAICAVFREVSQCPFTVPPGVKDSEGFVQFSLEKILDINPDVIFVRTYLGRSVSDKGLDSITNTSASVKQQLMTNPLWRELAAVKNGRVYEVDRSIWGGLGTHSLTVVLDEAMPKLYPQIFPQALP